MQRGHQAAAVRTDRDGGTEAAPGAPSRQPGQSRSPVLLPSAVAGAPGIPVRAVGTEPGSPRAAREFTRETLRRWDICAAFPDTAVVVSELVTNALCHGARIGVGGTARGRVELSLWHRASHLVCAVTDPSAEPAAHKFAGRAAHEDQCQRGMEVCQEQSRPACCSPEQEVGAIVVHPFPTEHICDAHTRDDEKKKRRP